MEVEVKVQGLAELEARLLELDALAGERLIKRVFRVALTPMFKSAQDNARSVGRSGALFKSVAIYNKRVTGKQVARTVVGSRAKNSVAVRMHNDAYRRKRKGIFYGWMLDQGHRVGTRKTGWLRKLNRSSGAGGAGVGFVRGHRWWTPAVTSNEQRARSSVVGELRKAVARLEKRSGKTPNPDSLVRE